VFVSLREFDTTIN